MLNFGINSNESADAPHHACLVTEDDVRLLSIWYIITYTRYDDIVYMPYERCGMTNILTILGVT